MIIRLSFLARLCHTYFLWGEAMTPYYLAHKKVPDGILFPGTVEISVSTAESSETQSKHWQVDETAKPTGLVVLLGPLTEAKGSIVFHGVYSQVA